VDQVAGVESDAKEIGGDESELRGADSNDTNDSAIEGGNDPALPELFANEHSRQDGQNAGDIIESNHVERTQHIGPMSRKRSLMEYSAGELTSMALLLKGEILLPDQRIIPGFLGDAYTDDVRATGSPFESGGNCEANSHRASERDVVLLVPSKSLWHCYLTRHGMPFKRERWHASAVYGQSETDCVSLKLLRLIVRLKEDWTVVPFAPAPFGKCPRAHA